MLGGGDVIRKSTSGTHLSDPSNLDAYALDELKRRGPNYGTSLPQAHAAVILSKLSEEFDVYKVSSLGYNNRLYFATSRSGQEFVIKICGRYWKRVKTETEVVGLFLASTLASIPAPRVLGWDAVGEEFAVEYTVMRKIEGIQLKEVWDSLWLEKKRIVIDQLAQFVVSYESTSGDLSTVIPQGKIGNFLIPGGGKCKRGATEVVDFEVGATLEGLGPWSTYKSYLRTQLEVKVKSVREGKGMESIRHLLPRVERFLENLDMDDRIPDSHHFVFTHGDLTLQNVLVKSVDKDLTITAILDWEWSGMFPEENEFFCSFDFLLEEDDGSESSQLQDHFFSILEAGGVGTPRTIPHYEQRKDLNDLRESLFPWYIADCEDSGEAAERSAHEVVRLLEKLNL